MSWLEMESVRETASLIGSLIAVVSTFYFWLVRSNRERPQLIAHAVGPLQGTLLTGMDDTATYRRLGPGEGQVVLKYWLHLALVNNSVLPNAVLGIHVWLKFNDGRWHEMDVAAAIPDEDLFPTNVDPLTTVGIKLALATKMPGEMSGGFKERERAAGDALPTTIPIRIELRALQNQSFVTELADEGRSLERTEPESLRAAA